MGIKLQSDKLYIESVYEKLLRQHPDLVLRRKHQEEVEGLTDLLSSNKIDKEREN